MNKSHFKVRAPDYTLLLLIIGIAALFIPKSGVITTGDTENYILYASKLFNGDGFIYLKRGPLFPIFITCSFYLFGTSIKSGYLVVRLFYALNVVVSYLLGRTIYNPWIGLAFSLLVLSSYGINFSSGFLLADTMTPFFLLLYLLLLYVAIVQDRLLYFVAAGITLGFEFLAHEYFAPFFALIPFFLLIPFKKFRCKRYLLGTGLMIVLFLITLLPWMIYVLNHGGNLSTFLGKAVLTTGVAVPTSSRGLSSQLWRIWELITGVDYFNAVSHLYTAKLYKYFVLAPLLVVSLLILLVKNIFKKALGDIFLLTSLFVLLPIMIGVGHKSLRIGGAIIFFFLLYLVFSKVLYETALLILGRIQSREVYGIALERIGPILFVCLFIGVISYQWLNPRISTKRLLIDGYYGRNNYYSKNTFWVDKEFRIIGKYNNDMEAASKWLIDNIKPDSKITLTFGPWAIDFFTNNKYSLCTYQTDVPYYNLIDNIANEGNKKLNIKILFIYPEKHHSIKKKGYRYINFILEDDLLSALKQNKIFIISKRGVMVYSLYLDQADWAQIVYENTFVKIYKIDTEAVASVEGFPLYVSNYYEGYITKWKEKYPDEVKIYNGLLKKLNLDKVDLSKMTYNQHQQNWVKKNIPQNLNKVSIAYSSSSGKFLIKNGYKTHFFYKDISLRWLEERFDYYFIDNSVKRVNKFPGLFNELKTKNLIITFPWIPVLGDGWEIYDLK